MPETTRRSFLQLAAAAPAVAQTASRRPNFIVLFADDMGYGDLSCYGNPTVRTPNLDRMAEEGMRFTSFYAAAPVCTPSRVGLLTGRYPVRAGLPNNLGPDSKGGLPLSEITMAQVLKTRGYRTMAIGKWHLGHDPKEYLPTSRGFDSYLGLLYSNDMIPPFVKTTRPLELYRDTEPVERMTDQSRLTERYTEEALRFIRASGKNPFFLYLPYAMPHLPVSAPEGRRGKSRAGLYGDVIETIDWSAGRILDTVKELGLDRDTMVVFASDNGPWHNLPARMLQQGNEPWHTGTKSLLRGAKGTTYEGGPRVPGIVRYPGVVPARQVCADPASTLDLLPTLAAFAGAEMPKDRVYDGFDLGATLRGKAPSPRTTFHYFLGAQLQGIREGAWKFRYARPWAGEGATATEPPQRELFHLDHDPAEQYNVAARYPETAAKLEAKMRAFAAELKAQILPA
jgi:arylsulfatase A-like enzyme